MWGNGLVALGAAGLAVAGALAVAACTPVARQIGEGAGGRSTTGSSAGGTTSGSSSSTSSTSSSSSSSSSGGGVETDCTNGVDDDGDGLTDCADPDCTGAGYQCAADAPPGWAGPATFYAGVGAPPSCGKDWTGQPAVGGLDVSSPPAGCSDCACSQPSNVACDGGALAILANDPQCTNGPSQLVGYGQCFSPGFSAQFVSVAQPKSIGGSCQPAGGAPNLPPAGFKTQAAVCDAPAAIGKGCSGGVCVPRLPPGYGPSVCVYTQGDVGCPGAPYVDRTVVYLGIDDTRGCSACTCDVPAGVTCPATYDVFGNPFFPGCVQQYANLPANGTCFNTPTTQNVGVVLQPSGPPAGGSCAPSVVQPIGAAVGAGPVTVCCL